MNAIIRRLAWLLLLLPAITWAQQTRLNAYQTVDLPVPASQAWAAINDFSNLSGWHPVFSASVLTGGRNNTPGATRRLTVKDGPSFDEELLSFDAANRRLSYRIIGENELPIANYESTIAVISTGRNSSAVLWQGSYNAKPGNDDAEMIKFIEGVYRAGLDNLKSIVR